MDITLLTNTLNEMCFCLGIIYILIIINWMYIFWKLRDSPQLNKRRPIIVLITGGVAIFAILESMAQNLMWGTTYGSYYINVKLDLKRYSWALHWAWGACSHMLLIYLTTYRALLTYIQMRYLQAVENNEWRLKLDPNVTNIYLKYHSHMTDKWIAGMLITSWSIFFIAGVYTSLMEWSFISRGILMIDVLIPMLIDLAIFCKFPRFYDAWNLHYEVKIIIVVEFSCQLIWGVVSVVLLPAHATPLYVIPILLAMTQSLLLPGISFMWVFHKFNLPQCWCSIERYFEERATEDELYLQQEQKEDEVLVRTKIKLRHILPSKHGFRLFARHLTHELAVENLLFFMATQGWLRSLLDRPEFEKYARSINYGNKSSKAANETPVISTIVEEEEVNVAGGDVELVTVGDELIPGNAKFSHVDSYSEDSCNISQTVDSNIVVLYESVGIGGSSSALIIDGGSSALEMNSALNIDGASTSSLLSMKFYKKNAPRVADKAMDLLTVCVQAAEIYLEFMVEAAYLLNISAFANGDLVTKFGHEKDSNSEEMGRNLIEYSVDNSSDEIFEIFDDSRQEALKLMQNSFRRLRRKKEFKEYVKKTNDRLVGKVEVGVSISTFAGAGRM